MQRPLKTVWVPVRRGLKAIAPKFLKEVFRAASIRQERRAQLSQLFSPDSTVTQPSIAYLATAGLGNRMRAHFIASDFAMRTGRQLVPSWVRNHQCGSGVEDLFNWNGPTTLPKNARPLIVEYEPREGVASCALDATIKAQHVVLDIPWQWIKRDDLLLRLGDRGDAARQSLVPRDSIIAQVDAVTRDWPSSVIGVHVRRGDFVTHSQQHIALERYVVAINRALEQAPSGTAMFFASDGTDEELAPLLSAVHCPIFRRPPAARDTIDGIQDALVTMLVLSRTRFNVLTPDSTFGDTACFLGNVPTSTLKHGESRHPSPQTIKGHH